MLSRVNTLLFFHHHETFIADPYRAGHVVGLGHAVSLFEDSDCVTADDIYLAPHGDYDYLVEHDVSLDEDCAGGEEVLTTGLSPSLSLSLALCACRTSSRRNHRPPPLDRNESLGSGVSARDPRHHRSRHAACAWKQWHCASSRIIWRPGLG